MIYFQCLLQSFFTFRLRKKFRIEAWELGQWDSKIPARLEEVRVPFWVLSHSIHSTFFIPTKANYSKQTLDVLWQIHNTLFFSFLHALFFAPVLQLSYSFCEYILVRTGATPTHSRLFQKVRIIRCIWII